MNRVDVVYRKLLGIKVTSRHLKNHNNEILDQNKGVHHEAPGGVEYFYIG